jgi:hypothetical protein
MWLTATDLDENDGKKDGILEVGALFRHASTNFTRQGK